MIVYDKMAIFWKEVIKMSNIFTKHPHSVNENYYEHMKFALKFGFNMVEGGVACMIHAMFPFVFQTKGSATAFDSVEDFLKRHPNNDDNEKSLLKLLEERKANQYNSEVHTS